MRHWDASTGVLLSVRGVAAAMRGKCPYCGDGFEIRRTFGGNMTKTCGANTCVKAHKNALRVAKNKEYRKTGKMQQWNRAARERAKATRKPKPASPVSKSVIIARDRLIRVVFKQLKVDVMRRDGVAECFVCGKIKAVDAFSPKKITKIQSGECRDCIAERSRQERIRTKRDPAKMAALNEYYKQYRKAAPAHIRIAHRMRGRIKDAIFKAKQGKWRGSDMERYLGCTAKYAKAYLESMFTRGMTWENYGYHGWHIDHVIPVSSFDISDERERVRAFHYTNIRPMWAKENAKKGDKITERQWQPLLIP